MRPIRPKEAVCASFNALELHDSRLIDILVSREPEGTQIVRLQVELLYGKHPSPRWKRVEITFYEVTFFRAELDLDYKAVCGDAIQSSLCQDRSELMARVERDRFTYEHLPLQSYLDFSLELCPPSGDVHVFAQEFDISELQEVRAIG